MERLVANILDMVRLESGGIVPRREWVPLEETVGSALSQAGGQARDREVRVEPARRRCRCSPWTRCCSSRSS